MSRGKSIRIFLADGAVTGIRHGEIVNWTGQALVAPRNRYQELKEWDEAAKPGVYFLFGEDDGGGQQIAYIGEAENVRDRLRSHIDNKDFWNETVLFTNKDENLTKAHARYLESRLISSAKKSGRYRVENTNEPQPPKLPKGDLDAMEDFYDNLRLLLGALGHKVLEPVVEEAKENASVVELFLKKSNIEAKAQLTDEGVVVLPHSKLSKKVSPSLSDGYTNLRRRLIEQKIVEEINDELEFRKEYLFTSPSAAAAVICGYPCNGRDYWKDATGRTLAQIEEI